LLFLSFAGTAMAQAPVAGQPYFVPAGYEGYGAGTTISYGGYNYVLQGNGTMLLAAGGPTYQYQSQYYPTRYNYQNQQPQYNYQQQNYQQPQYTYQQPQYYPTQYNYPMGGGGVAGVGGGTTRGNAAVALDPSGNVYYVPIHPGHFGGHSGHPR
jgi:hypothetical protein